MFVLQGCIAMSMSLHRTTFCFVCSHLASGEKEGDELRRNSDVNEILKSTQFPRICKTPGRRIPEKILEHEYGFITCNGPETRTVIYIRFFNSFQFIA